ncbi:anaphase-promoting complex subunit 11 isoform X3 [Amborella trichopoda]|uniref:anaphase-promoting complex subunit 11 isoform X3 n=1 Tax=Amborella trichopoda TaxID=13333 RepID=UPI0009BCE974|nr:anaphase-promoting complex subunit 11 isoform X3 [Amborella trichopoda]|eukprot:XP_020521529.1 anaphase-promoting complex subunit 11 isoform X3 [Amborella trichopoda]
MNFNFKTFPLRRFCLSFLELLHCSVAVIAGIRVFLTLNTSIIGGGRGSTGKSRYLCCLRKSGGDESQNTQLTEWHAIASWTWDAQDETCGICRMAFDGCCPDCKFPGDDCPLIWGACNHAFHLHCILKWVNSQTPQPQCPMCRREWQFKE